MAAVTLKEHAYIKLHQLILNGDIKPGEFLTERTLVEMLGMSRTPIRSALERLDVEGLANYTPNKGLIVAEISIKRAIDLYDFRVAMECYVVKKLAQLSWQDEDIHWFEENLRQQEHYMLLKDYANFTLADSQFHRRLAMVNENSEIMHAMEQLQDKLYQIAIKVLRKDHNRIQVSYDDHMRIFGFIKDGNADEATQAMERHLAYGKSILVM